MTGDNGIVPIPSAVIVLLGLTAVFVAAVVPGGTIAGPLLAIFTCAFVKPWASSAYGLPVRFLLLSCAALAVILAAIRAAA